MVEYPIQIRWPYEPPLARGMRHMDWMRWFSYHVLFLGTSADFIRTYFAFRDWQKETIEHLLKFVGRDDTQVVVYNPQQENFDINNQNATIDQITWEVQYLSNVDLFSMYFVGGDQIQPICMYELGRYMKPYGDQQVKYIFESIEKVKERKMGEADMSMRICLEEDYVLKTLAKSKKNDLAVVDIDNIDPKYVREAVGRGVHVYAYLNACALEKERDYYEQFKDLRIAPYSGWPGEYWVDVTAEKWQKHLLSEAERFKEAGAKGLYFDNCDLFYMCISGFREEKTKLIKPAPRAWSVYESLLKVTKELVHGLGLVVMPNGADTYVRKLINNGHKDLVKTVIQESVLYSDSKRVAPEDTAYFTEYLDWCKKNGVYIRGIEYTKKLTQEATAKAYYRRHGWQAIYISKHHSLKGD